MLFRLCRNYKLRLGYKTRRILSIFNQYFLGYFLNENFLQLSRRTVGFEGFRVLISSVVSSNIFQNRERESCGGMDIFWNHTMCNWIGSWSELSLHLEQGQNLVLG